MTEPVFQGALRPLLLLLLWLPASAALAVTAKPATFGMEIQAASIPMPDGVRLSADLYRPTGGKAGERFPVLLEYLPYRKHEARSRNWALYSYFVRRGYVVAFRSAATVAEERALGFTHSHNDDPQVLAAIARRRDGGR